MLNLCIHVQVYKYIQTYIYITHIHVYLQVIHDGLTCLISACYLPSEDDLLILFLTCVIKCCLSVLQLLSCIPEGFKIQPGQIHRVWHIMPSILFL